MSVDIADVKLVNGKFLNCYYSYREKRYILPMNGLNLDLFLTQIITWIPRIKKKKKKKIMIILFNACA